MSGIKKTQSLGHCPIRSTDLRRSPGASAFAGALSFVLSEPLSCQQHGLGLEPGLDLARPGPGP